MDTPASTGPLPGQEPTGAAHPRNSTGHNRPYHSPNPKPIAIEKKKSKITSKDALAMPWTSIASSSSSSSSSATRRITRVAVRPRNTKLVFAPARRAGGGRAEDAYVEAIAFPLGMSFAAFVSQVLERKDAVDEQMPVDHLSTICALVVKESLVNVFGNKFDFFARNFEKSFGSTLMTLRLINQSDINKGTCDISHLKAKDSTPYATHNERVGYANCCDVKCCSSETDLPTASIQNGVHIAEEVEESVSTDCLSQELALNGAINHIAHAPSSSFYAAKQLYVVEKSAMEQARANDLKTLEIGLTMQRLKLKKEQLDLSFDSNHLERSKLAMGISKASFKAEKFKTQLEDARHAELLRKYMDCLVAGLFVVSASLLYGAYVHSYKRITEATMSCNSKPEDFKSWWMPRQISTFNSGLDTLRCQVQVWSRMLFGILMVFAVAYLFIQRSATSQQNMPVTFILLLLGAACGFAGKICVDALGGSGMQWLLYWEALCMVHLFSISWTPILFRILNGPVSVSQGARHDGICPFWFRRFLFYAIVLLILPLCCGLLPFASPGEWKEHLLLLAADFYERQVIGPRV